jgi:glucose-6-phosphate isomerase
MLNPNDYPTSVKFDFNEGSFSPLEKKVERHVSDMAVMWHDQEAAQAAISNGDRLVYEIFYQSFTTSKSDMALGTTRISPGTIGDEYHMTKGHFHEAEDQPEVYFCLQGEGYLLLETLEGEFRAERWEPGTISHIPPMWAHRVVNTSKENLVFVAVYHLSAGHNYAPVEQKGFAQVVVERDGEPVFISNDRRES